MQPRAVPPPAPDWIVGLWKRESITLADGTVDRDTRVYWGQTKSLYVDIRVPADRSRMSPGETFSVLSPRAIQPLTRQRGFAGHIIVTDNQCTWFRDIDYQPDTGRPDTGLLRLDDDTLYETGTTESVVGAGYEEVYRRVRRGDRLRAALRQVEPENAPLADSVETGSIIVLLDDRFLSARPRAAKLPAADSLRSLIDGAGQDWSRIHSLLDCEICLGTIDQHDGLRIDLSTIPFREGQRLFPFMSAESNASGTHLILRSAQSTSHWQILETSVHPRDILKLFAA